MENAESEKRKRLFARDGKLKRTGVLVTFGGTLLLLVAVLVIVTTRGDAGQGASTLRLLAYILLPAVFVAETAYFIYALIVRGKVKKILAAFSYRKLKKEEAVLPSLPALSLVYRYEKEKKFSLFERSAPGRKIVFSYAEFTSLYEGDTDCYEQTAVAVCMWLKDKNFVEVTLSADYKDKKIGVRSYTLIADGVPTDEMKKRLKRAPKGE